MIVHILDSLGYLYGVDAEINGDSAGSQGQTVDSAMLRPINMAVGEEGLTWS
jgi:hypothetical protein